MKQGKTTRRAEEGGRAVGYVTVKEAAAFFKVDPSTVRRWIAHGVLSAVRIGKTTVRVDLTSVRAEPIGASA